MIKEENNNYKEYNDHSTFGVRKLQFDISPITSPKNNHLSRFEERNSSFKDKIPFISKREINEISNNFERDLDDIIKRREFHYDRKRNDRIYTLKHRVNPKEEKSNETVSKLFDEPRKYFNE